MDILRLKSVTPCDPPIKPKHFNRITYGIRIDAYP